MADDADFSTTTVPSLQQLVDYFVESLFDPTKLQQLKDTTAAAYAKGTVEGKAADRKALEAMHKDATKILGKTEQSVEEWIGAALSKLVGDILGVDVPASSLAKRSSDLGQSGVGRTVGDTVLKAIRGRETELTPGADGAERLMGIAAHITLHGWFVGLLVERAEKFFSLSGPMENIARLGEELVEAMGVGRLARVALRPLAQILMATPLQWDLHKQLRPTMLSDSSVIRQWMRGHWAWADVQEVLARAGHSEANIAALLNEQRKFLAVGDVRELLVRETWTQDQALTHLRDQGYDENAAQIALRVEGIRRIASHETSLASAILSAYTSRDIDDGEFSSLINASIGPPSERALLTELGQTRRALNIRHLSSAQAESCVFAKVLPIASYRDALFREGYEPDAALALELLLETKIDAGANVDALRKQKADAAAADAKAKADALAKKKADAEQAAALKRRGPISELERAAVRGLIPIARVEEVLRADYDADTVQIYVADIEGQRAAYVAQQQKADDAAKRAANKGLNIGQLEQAVLDGVLTLQEFAMQLSRFELAPADQAILVATLTVRKADADAAAAKRRDAETRAQLQKINLGTFEQLVRAGIRSLADYDSLLISLGYGDADRADLGALLQQRINADAAAKQLRDETAAKNAARGLSLDQERRAVILDVRTLDQFQTWLVQQKYTVDAASVLVDELRDDVTKADAARAKREAAASSSGAAGVPLSTVTRAARLGILTPAQYQAALVKRGYARDDIALEFDLLSQEIANVKSAKHLQAAADAGSTDTALSLAQLAAAVKAGEASLAFYRSRAIALGLSDDDADRLTRVLGDELANTTAAKARRAALESTVKPGDVALSVLEQRVREGSLALADFAAMLTDAGLDPVDVDLLTNLLADEGAGNG